LVLGAEDWSQPALRESWQHFVILLRQQVTGLPVIDLSLVPLQYQLQHAPIDCASDSGIHLVDQGLSAGLRELRGRIEFMLGRP